MFTASTAPVAQQRPALLRDITDLVSSWDTSRPPAELITAISERFQFEFQAEEATSAGKTKTGIKKRGKCMSRRPGQDGSKEYKEGGWWKVRVWVDIPGQTERSHPGIPICPVEGPGALNASERSARKREIIAEHTGKNKEVVEDQSAVTFEKQAEIMLQKIGDRRREPVAEGTLARYERDIRLHLNPILGKLSLANIWSPQLKMVGREMERKGHAASTIKGIVEIAKMVVESAIDAKTGEPLYPRKWNSEIIDLPTVNSEEQNTPSFSRENLTGLAAYPEPRMRMLFTLCGATGARIAELSGLEIDKHISPDYRTITICQQAARTSKAPKRIEAIYRQQAARKGKVLKRVKKPASRRQVDLHPDIAAVLRDFVGDRQKGFLFTTSNNAPVDYTYIWLHLQLALKALGYTNDKAKTGLAGAHAFRRARNTFLRNETECPEGLLKFWMGHKASKDMTDLYDKIKNDRQLRLEWAERCGYGFDLPTVVPLYWKQGQNEEAA